MKFWAVRRRGKVRVGNPLKSGYGRQTVATNITKLMAAGYPEHQATSLSLRAARLYYRRRYPQGPYPDHLKTPRRKPSWLAEWTKRRKNAGKKSARRFYRQFHWGDEPDRLLEASVPAIRPGDVLTSLGELAEVTYDTTKKGQRALWEHTFKHPRPHLAVTPEKDLAIIGGAYDVNERGIVG